MGYNRQYGIRANIVMGCVDKIEPREIFQWALRERKVQWAENQLWYWMDFGNDLNSGQVILGGKLVNQPEIKGTYITRAKLPTAIEMMPTAVSRIMDEDDQPSCSVQQAIEKQDLFINSTVADAGCHMLWQFLRTGYITYNAIFINLETGNIGRNKL